MCPGYFAAVVVEIVSEDLLEEYGESADPAMIYSFYLVSHQVFGLVAQGYHQFAHFLSCLSHETLYRVHAS